MEWVGNGEGCIVGGIAVGNKVGAGAVGAFVIGSGEGYIVGGESVGNAVGGGAVGTFVGSVVGA